VGRKGVFEVPMDLVEASDVQGEREKKRKPTSKGNVSLANILPCRVLNRTWTSEVVVELCCLFGQLFVRCLAQ